MTRQEFVSQHQLQLEKRLGADYGITIGELSQADWILGCYFNDEKGMWIVYETTEKRWTGTRLETASEDEAFDRLFSIIQRRIEEREKRVKSRLMKLATQIMYVDTAQCSHCNYIFPYVSESADTDMVSCYCGSVYSAEEQQLVIAKLTAEEYSYGCFGRLDVRINAICGKHDYKCHDFKPFTDFRGREHWRMVCPCCDNPIFKQETNKMPVKYYCTLHPNTLIVYEDEEIRNLKEELEKYA